MAVLPTLHDGVDVVVGQPENVGGSPRGVQATCLQRFGAQGLDSHYSLACVFVEIGSPGAARIGLGACLIATQIQTPT